MRQRLSRMINAVQQNGLMPLLLRVLGLTADMNETVKTASQKFLAQGRELSPELFKKVYSVRFSSREAKSFLALVCAAINGRSGPGEDAAAQRAAACLEQHGVRFSARFLADMELLAMCGGLFVLSGEIRKCHESVLTGRYARKNRVRSRDAVRLFWCYAGASQAAEAQGVLPRTGRLYRRVSGDELRALGAMLGRERIPAPGGMDGQSKRFGEHIRGKQVAIIGPSTDPIDPREIGEDTVVISMNYRGPQTLREELVSAGVRVDISYYRMSNILKKTWRENHAEGAFLKDLFMYVVSPKEVPENSSLWAGSDNMRHACVFNDRLLFLGDPQMVQSILIDLLHFSPASIKLFCVNFYLSEERHHPRYTLRDSGDRSQYRSYYSWAGHNLISQYEFTRMLFLNGAIEADPACAAILGLGTDEYLRRLERLQRPRP